MMARLVKALRLFVVYPLFSLLPPAVAYRLAAFAYRFDPVLRRPTRLAAAQGMRRVLAEAQDPSRLRRLVDAYQAMLGRELLDVYYLPRLSARNIDRWVDIEGLEALAAPRPDGRGRVLAMAHFSRPSLLFAALSLKGVKIHVLTQAIDRTNPELDAIDRAFLRFKVWGNCRHLLGRWITVAENPRFLYERLRAGDTVVILFDVRAAGGPTIDVPLLGHRLRLPQGIVRLAAQTNAALLYGAIRDEGWRARIRIQALPEGEATAAFEAAVATLEREVREAPAQWWQWNVFDYLLAPSPEEPSGETQPH
ncbi:MAG: hypothetical protein A3F74_06990 [Betaproteobacteria bacterium RIFCSPLOWO2_12_FULL_62_58]|nr:MAG: hypothetical protein A3F74_06990 [Betaproteobacteria bacterium RIFCSPLOWO2_12_FULL_62_58]